MDPTLKHTRRRLNLFVIPLTRKHVLELLSAIEGGSISRSKFAHHLRAHLAESITRIEECAIAAGAKIEVEREVSEKERREMENEDYRLQAKRQKDRLNVSTQRRRVNNFYASIRGGDIYACVCNGNFIGDSYRLHPPAHTFHTAIDPEWHFWTPAEFEAWCRRLAEDYIGLTDADYFPDLVCADCFEFTSEFKPERWEELQLTREKTRLETMSDSDVFECEKLKRDEKYARCRAKFSPTRPAGWNDAKFCGQEF